MNNQQSHLLKLIKEIDSICKKYGITYYCAGGTVIGAARHKGFIPWDDDIDIYMTHENFIRFEEAFNKEKPEGRSLEFNISNRDYHSLIPRYMEENTSMFSVFDMLGHASAGVLIDIFILDPVPGDRESRQKMLADMYLYNDIVLPFYVFSHRLPTEDLALWEKCRKEIEEKGELSVQKELEEKLFSHSESECDTYMLRWGSLTNFFPKEMMGEPVYMQFEDIQLPMPEKWYDYLVHLYGSDWMTVPYIESQGEHNNIKSYDHSYQIYYEERDRLFSEEQLLEMYNDRKYWRIEMEKSFRPIEQYMFETKCRICNNILEKKLSLINNNSDYEDIFKAFKTYLDMQTSRDFMGEMRHGFYYRWMNPLVIPIDNDNLSMLFSSLFALDKITVAEKLIKIYQRAGISNKVIDEAAKSIDALNNISCLYYCGKYDECIQKADVVCEKYIEKRLIDFKLMSLAKLNPDENTLSMIKRYIDEDPNNINIKKAYADVLFALNDEECVSIYNEILDNSRNGLFWLDIINTDKVQKREMVYTKESEYIKDSITDLQNEMLHEIKCICEANNIKYVLGSNMAKRIVQFGNIGYAYSNKTLYMDADNACRFMQAFENEGRKDRKLLSWLNDETVSDFVMMYTDSNSVYVNFKTLQRWQGLGIYLRIIILRSGYASSLYRKKTFFKEFILNLQHLEKKDERLLGLSFKKKVLHKLITNKHYKQDFSRNLFNEIIETEIKEKKGKFYYIKNTRGKRPKEVLYSDSNWYNTAIAEMNGEEYVIPVSVKEGFNNKTIKTANLKKSDSIFSFFSTELSWDELNKIINWDDYNNLDWKSYEINRIKTNDLNRKNRRVWGTMLRFEDLRLMRPVYNNLRSDILKAVSVQDYNYAKELFFEYDIKVKEYNNMGLSFVFDKELTDAYLKYLDNTGQRKLKKSIMDKTDGSENNYL